ncbi:hypothetical protein PC39_06379 [Salinisphaera sp. PC39]|uniref:sulfite exporter TauE/SafE family protein n=1 Tax=Salinisphaera sp. PC39 TaxID=1304156 RepID=UPI0033429AB2
MAIFLGALAGLALGLSAAGGSLFLLPLLLHGLGFPVPVALSVALAALALMAAIGAGDAARARLLDTRAGLALATGGVVAAPAGVYLGAVLPAGVHMSAFAFLAVVVGLGLLWLAASRPAAAGIVRAGLVPEPAAVTRSWRRGGAAALISVGAVAGLLSGMFGIGAAFLSVPVCMIVARHSRPRAMGAALLAIALTALSGLAAIYAGGTDIPWFDTGLFVFGAVAGMGVARRLAPLMAGPVLQAVLGAALALTGLALLLAPRFPVA